MIPRVSLDIHLCRGWREAARLGIDKARARIETPERDMKGSTRTWQHEQNEGDDAQQDESIVRHLAARGSRAAAGQGGTKFRPFERCAAASASAVVQNPMCPPDSTTSSSRRSRAQRRAFFSAAEMADALDDSCTLHLPPDTGPVVPTCYRRRLVGPATRSAARPPYLTVLARNVIGRAVLARSPTIRR